MKIHDLFVKPVDRSIEGVIKADDDRNLLTEVEEYVVTAEVATGLGHFAEAYLDNTATGANGVWISGFFGSGKSHLLKILSLLLENDELPGGARVANLLLPKIEDEILRGELQRALKIPSRSILFNIDQKSDSIGGDQNAPVLEVFMKVLNELQGYYGRQGHIAQFEYDLDARGELEPFKATYARISGRSWIEDRPVVETLETETFAQAYAEHFGKSYDEGMKLFDRNRANYKVSIEAFAQRVKEYIDRQAPGFRLNFFVDEAGQFIGQDSSRMLNLQTIVESLSTVCRGRAWVFVTSQGDLQGLLGEMTRKAGQDFSKIEGRFRTRLTLTSANVREVIQKRLLAKREAEPEALTSIYDAEKENLLTLYRFSDGSMDYKRWRGSDEFCDFYPFVPYQFDLFQRAIRQLSEHNAFTGRHTAVGERSMLAVFQEVIKRLRHDEVGRMVTFDLMFDGVAASLRGDFQTSLRLAERQLSDLLAVRILKALFLLKWVREFKPTARNVAILLIDKPNVDIQQHEKAVREALNLLEGQSYLQRNGEVYEFLTDVEKDIEVEIKNTEITEGQLPRLLTEVLFADVLRDPKIRYDGNGQDYAYARSLDDELQGRDADIAVNIITSEHDQHDNPTVLAAQNMGKAELMVLLPDDKRLTDDCRLFLKTHKYIQQNTSGSLDETRREVLTQRGQQNSTRRTILRDRCAELLGAAQYYLNGSPLLISGADARNRFAKAGQELIAFAYPKLKMIRGAFDEALLSKTLLQADDLFGAQNTLSEAEQEVLTYVQRNQNQGERTSVESIVREFGRKPYGWYMFAVVTQLARLFRMGKIELRSGDLLDARRALDALKNPRQHGGVRVSLQEQFDPGKVTALKRFYQDFFDRANSGTDPRSVARRTAETLAEEAREAQGLLDQAGRYPFLRQLQPLITRIQKLSDRDDGYLLNQMADFANDLLDAKENTLAPIKGFMRGPQRQAYDDVVTFYREEEANFAELTDQDLAPVRALVESPAPFRGNVLPAARGAVTKLRETIAARLAAERQTALATVNGYEARLRALPEFSDLKQADVEQVLRACQDARNALQAARFISAVRDRLSRYTLQDYPQQLALAQRLAARPPDGQPGEPQIEDPPAPSYTTAASLRADCALPYIANEAELDQWLSALRAAALAELKKGKRISL